MPPRRSPARPRCSTGRGTAANRPVRARRPASGTSPVAFWHGCPHERPPAAGLGPDRRRHPARGRGRLPPGRSGPAARSQLTRAERHQSAGRDAAGAGRQGLGLQRAAVGWRDRAAAGRRPQRAAEDAPARLGAAGRHAGGRRPELAGDPGRAHGAWLVVQPTGSGTVVRLGGASALVNQRINRTDNAVLIVGLLSPAPGPEVVVLRPPPPGGGSKGLSDLIAPRVKLTLVQLVVAFLLLALWRSRRLGRPVTEPTAVRIPGSELVVAVGNLLQRARHRGQAAALLAGDLRRGLTERLGLPAAAPPEQVADTVAARTGLDRDRVLAALQPPTPRDEAALVALAQAIDTIRMEVSSAHGAR